MPSEVIFLWMTLKHVAKCAFLWFGTLTRCSYLGAQSRLGHCAGDPGSFLARAEFLTGIALGTVYSNSGDDSIGYCLQQY